MSRAVSRKVWQGSVAVVLTAMAACAPVTPPPPPPAPPPPPKPVAIVVPPRPLPPLGASPNVTVPALGLTGVRQTVNAGISAPQATWNVRAAFNVAALNCLKPEHAEILPAYKAYLKTHVKGLTAANKAVDGEFRSRHGAAFIKPREAYMTQVYNYFAFPPTLNNFCDSAVLMARDAQLTKAADLSTFSAAQLPRLEGVFDQFYRAYEQYRTDAALWDARYQPVLTPAPLPGAVPAVIATPAPVSAPVPAPSPTPGVR